METKYVMVESNLSTDDDEIDVLELIRVVLRSWKLITLITILCTGLAVAYALLAPELFKAQTLLAPVQEENPRFPSSMGQFGGLAAMAGISIPRDSNIERVLATLQSRKFLTKYIEKRNLLPILFEDSWDQKNKAWALEPNQEEPTFENGISVLRQMIAVDENKQSGLISLSISWKDPEVAAKWANDLVRQLNEQLREKAKDDSKKRIGYLKKELADTTLNDMQQVLYSLLESEKQKAMLANVNEDFALEVIDPAVAPEQREKPKRKLIVAIGGVCGGFFGILSVFFLRFIRKLKGLNDGQSEANA